MEVWELTLDEFVKASLVLDIFLINGRTNEDYDVIWRTVAAPESLRFPVWLESPYRISEIKDFEPGGTFVLIHDIDGAVGFYMDGQCWIDPAHRGKKLSTHLILAAAEFAGGSPVPCEMGFSNAGYAAHKAAHAFAVQEAIAAGRPVPDHVIDEIENMPTVGMFSIN